MTSPMIAPTMPVITTNTAVRSGVPPISPEIVIAKGVLIERGSRLRRMVPFNPRNAASAHDDNTEVHRARQRLDLWASAADLERRGYRNRSDKRDTAAAVILRRAGSIRLHALAPRYRA